MPVSTDRHSGFPISKWELKYLRCRFTAHRNKIAAAKPAIDANPPPERPHVSYKKKKALQEERRQIRVVQENLRLLDRTMNIMASTNMPTHFTNSRPALFNGTATSPTTKGDDHEERKEDTRSNPVADDATCFSSAQQQKNRRKTQNKKYFDRPLTARLKRNTHIIFHWFIQRFGRYVPWQNFSMHTSDWTEALVAVLTLAVSQSIFNVNDKA